MATSTISPFNEKLADFDHETKRVLYLIAIEMQRAEEKHPYWPEDPIHAAAIVAEEAGECVQAALQHRYEAASLAPVGEEAIHTAATCVRLLKNLKA